MSEHEPDELGSALRVLAADASVPPTLSGGQIRRRGEARGRRRRALVATAAVVVLGTGAAVGVPWVMDGHKEDRRPVAIDPSSPSSAPVFVYAPPRIDIRTKVLTLRPAGEKARSFHLTMSDDVTAGKAKVAFKNPKLKLPALLSTPPDTAYEVEVNWAVNLSLPNGEALYLVADHVSGIRMHPGVLRMPAADAKWVYDRLKVGDTVTLT